MFGELQGTSQLPLMREATIGGRKKKSPRPGLAETANKAT